MLLLLALAFPLRTLAAPTAAPATLNAAQIQANVACSKPLRACAVNLLASSAADCLAVASAIGKGASSQSQFCGGQANAAKEAACNAGLDDTIATCSTAFASEGATSYAFSFFFAASPPPATPFAPVVFAPSCDKVTLSCSISTKVSQRSDCAVLRSRAFANSTANDVAGFCDGLSNSLSDASLSDLTGCLSLYNIAVDDCFDWFNHGLQPTTFSFTYSLNDKMADFGGLGSYINMGTPANTTSPVPSATAAPAIPSPPAVTGVTPSVPIADNSQCYAFNAYPGKAVAIEIPSVKSLTAAQCNTACANNTAVAGINYSALVQEGGQVSCFCLIGFNAAAATSSTNCAPCSVNPILNPSYPAQNCGTANDSNGYISSVAVLPISSPVIPTLTASVAPPPPTPTSSIPTSPLDNSICYTFNSYPIKSKAIEIPSQNGKTPLSALQCNQQCAALANPDVNFSSLVQEGGFVSCFCLVSFTPTDAGAAGCQQCVVSPAVTGYNPQNCGTGNLSNGYISTVATLAIDTLPPAAVACTYGEMKCDGVAGAMFTCNYVFDAATGGYALDWYQTAPPCAGGMQCVVVTGGFAGCQAAGGVVPAVVAPAVVKGSAAAAAVDAAPAVQGGWF
ncbi:hypothetical protein HDU98_001420 [Podochytrium sp. JEL0797]|nr:hypothetical protein HDU98_001420 [Podochytrium sp. JEL0797]